MSIVLDEVTDADRARRAPASGTGKLINIDNGGTLTDICVIEGAQVWRTKTLTTPYDLSKCLFEGLRKISRVIYGEEDLLKLLLSTAHIRYSTTQGTNALVERKGPRLGLLLSGLDAAALQQDAQQRDVFGGLVGTRVETLDLGTDEAALEVAATQAINRLASAGANRIVIGVGGAQRDAGETRLKKMLLKKFPPHLLGAIPLLYSHEVVQDDDDVRRVWTALFNAFLHPAMERFLYSAEHRLREYKTKNPLLIFRNDGDSARVSRTAAIKTYSSGPRGGAEGAKALAAHYGFERLLGMDVGGTTTDVSLVEAGAVRTDRRGRIEGVATSLALCNVTSAGVGGSSILSVVDGRIKVGPESVGGAPGPACFGLGGTEATITDAFLVQGLLDPVSYFGGELKIDVERARAAIDERIAKPLKLSVEDAAAAMEQAWVQKVADALKAFTTITPDTTLAAFGGGGPFLATRIAEAAGIKQVLIPGLAAVFSAFGIGFSDIAHEYEAPLTATDAATLKATREQLLERARRGMFAEGFDLADCRIETWLQVGDELQPLLGDALPSLPQGAKPSLLLKATRIIARATLAGQFGSAEQAAIADGTRQARIDGQAQALPLYRTEQQSAGVQAQGPCVLEDAFFTARIDAGWRFEINASGDILLTKQG
ncbi:hydantoinase/oxoprolinase family protein [Solimonas marina]|uniref:Hydantoinase/oxoprolinase family protein n=1 Tax=Solimonas marina TaxID=2714601 RepID=A0A969W8H9_9GAMM|nr:hydantoinase/oxoprolinase family protein [Solimonas marina]NKF21854.1 hydantoinase/oxoprolinase family protein [Solimonas marina]